MYQPYCRFSRSISSAFSPSPTAASQIRAGPDGMGGRGVVSSSGMSSSRTYRTLRKTEPLKHVSAQVTHQLPSAVPGQNVFRNQSSTRSLSPDRTRLSSRWSSVSSPSRSATR